MGSDVPSGVFVESALLNPLVMVVVMEAVLLSTQLVPLTVDVPSGASVERDLLMLMLTVMEVVLPSIQLVPHMLPEAHKDFVESDLLNLGIQLQRSFWKLLHLQKRTRILPRRSFPWKAFS